MNEHVAPGQRWYPSSSEIKRAVTHSEFCLQNFLVTIEQCEVVFEISRAVVDDVRHFLPA